MKNQSRSIWFFTSKTITFIILYYFLSQFRIKTKRVLLQYIFRKSFNWITQKICLCIKCKWYDRTDASEGIDINKTSASKEFDICHYWYFLNRGFKFQTYICNRCHGLFLTPMMPYLWCLFTMPILLFQKWKILIIVVLLAELAKVKLWNQFDWRSGTFVLRWGAWC